MRSSSERRTLDAETLPLVAQLVADGRRVRVRVSGRSMWPALLSGDTVELGPVGELEYGQLVLLATAEGRPLLHRVVELERGADGELWVRTRGDALAGSDPWMPRALLVACVVAVEPRHGLTRLAVLLHGLAARCVGARAVGRAAEQAEGG